MKFSIITPSFRQLDWLRLCVASVADQARVEVEQIIQDAGTGPELENWARSQPRVRLFVEADAGMYDAINRGLRRATGEICAYLNCDEQYLPCALSRVAKFFEAHPKVDVLFGDVILIDENGYPLSYRRTVMPNRRHVWLAHLNTPSCATFFRRRLLEQGFYFEARWKAIGDAVWVENLLQRKVKMATLAEPLAVFTFTGKNLGATALSQSESVEWKGPARTRRLFARGVAILGHRLRKAFAGAYRRRRVEIDVFTLESPDRRQHFQSTVGFGWRAA